MESGNQIPICQLLTEADVWFAQDDCTGREWESRAPIEAAGIIHTLLVALIGARRTIVWLSPDPVHRVAEVHESLADIDIAIDTATARGKQEKAA